MITAYWLYWLQSNNPEIKHWRDGVGQRRERARGGAGPSRGRAQEGASSSRGRAREGASSSRGRASAQLGGGGGGRGQARGGARRRLGRQQVDDESDEYTIPEAILNSIIRQPGHETVLKITSATAEHMDDDKAIKPLVLELYRKTPCQSSSHDLWVRVLYMPLYCCM